MKFGRLLSNLLLFLMVVLWVVAIGLTCGGAIR